MIDAMTGPPGGFAKRLRALREQVGLTQQELARAAGISAAAVRDLEQGRSRNPRQRSLRALSAALGLSPEDAAELRDMALVQAVGGDEEPPDAINGPTRISILGPLGVSRGTRGVPLRAGRYRTVLGRLALVPNAPVARDELVHLLWGDAVPASAVNLVQTHVSRLRRILEPERATGVSPEMLTLVAGGYRLNVDTDQLDMLAFRDLVSRARLTTDLSAALDLLDTALDLWHGEPLADVPELRDDPLVARLVTEHVDAAVLHARLAVALSRVDQALPRLRELARQHPLHEPLQARLVVALAAVGQQAAALTTYESIRRRLTDELGIDPGPELVEAHRAVLGPAGLPASGDTGITATEARPFQVPAPPPDFTGRRDQLDRLARLVGRNPAHPAPESVTVCVISGVAGVGKTALAFRAAQLLRPSFPDGQLYIDLRGFGPSPVPPVEALARFLRALGLDGRRVPRDEAECAALFRSVLNGRRMLVVLDNARSAAQLRALLPGTGGSAVLVTSRSRLADLAGAVVVEMDVPSPAEALDLLAATAGPARVAGEPEASAELVVACGRLPIALRVAGSRLASRPSWTIRAVVDRLADGCHRLDRLRVGDVAVEASFDLSYQELSPVAARVFRLLALLPGEDFGQTAALVATDGDPVEIEEALHELVDGHLVQASADGRHRYHDLLRLYAVRRADSEDSAEERSAAVGRLLDWYLERTVAAMRHVYPEMVRLPVDVPKAAPFASEEAALAWLDAELTGLTAAVGAAAHGPAPHRAWQIADQLRGYFFLRRQVVPWLATGRAGRAAAERAGDVQARAAMYQTTGQAYWSISQHESALAEYERAAALAEEAGWLVGLAYQWHNIGLVQAELGRLDEAQESYRRALRVGWGPEFDHVRAVTLNDLGTLCHERGLLTDAAAHFTEALAVNQGASRRPSAMANQANLGMVLRQLGDHENARRHLTAALEHFRRTGSPKAELSVLDELSQLHTQCDEPEAAVATATRALDLTRRLGDRRSEAALLSTLGSALLCAGAVADAGDRFAQSLALAGQLSSPYFEVQARIGLSRVRLVSGAVHQARTEAGQAAEIARRVGYRLLEGDALLALARVCVALGQDEEAERCCREALAIHQTNGSPEQAQEATSVLAGLAASRPASRRRAARQLAPRPFHAQPTGRQESLYLG